MTPKRRVELMRDARTTAARWLLERLDVEGVTVLADTTAEEDDLVRAYIASIARQMIEPARRRR